MKTNKRMGCVLCLLALVGAGCSRTWEADPQVPGPTVQAPAAPQPAAEEGTVTFQAEDAAYPVDAGAIAVTVTNDGTEEISYGEYYTVEILQDEQWEAIPFQADFGFHDIGILLAPGKERRETIALENCDFTFEAGRYRVVKEIGGQRYTAEFALVPAP